MPLALGLGPRLVYSHGMYRKGRTSFSLSKDGYEEIKEDG